MGWDLPGREWSESSGGRVTPGEKSYASMAYPQDRSAGAAGQGPAANQKGHVYKTQGTGTSCPAIVSGVLPQEKRGATNSLSRVVAYFGLEM